MNFFLCDSMLSQTKNRKLHETLSDVNQYTESKENELHQQPNVLNTGSSAEGLGILGRDTDGMIIDLNKTVKFNEFNESRDLFADTRNCVPGFCNIIVKPSTELESQHINADDVVVINNICYLRRDKFIKHFKENYPGFYQSIETGPALNIERIYDAVPTLACVDWPQESQNYFTRQRNWPKQKLLSQINKMGMHIVGVPSANTERQCMIEFRLSFSLAEKTLLRNLSDLQFATYWLLKSVKNSIQYENDKECEDDSVLKSYFLKIALLRRCEEMKLSIWTRENFLDNAKFCFIYLYHSFQRGVLQHLFLKNCNLLANFPLSKLLQGQKELENIVFNWDTVLQSTFFMDEFLDNQNPYSKEIVTRSVMEKINSELMDDHKSRFRVDQFPLCLEAESFSIFIYGADYRDSHDMQLVMEANTISESQLYKIVPEKYFDIARALLLRRVVNITLRHGRSRKAIDFCLELLENAQYQETLIYPISGFVDNVSSKIWIAYINYLRGNISKTLQILESIEDFDTLSPIGYMYIWINDYDKSMLIHNDNFLADFLEKVLCFDNPHKRSFICNCIVLAHYMRSKLIKSISDIDTLTMYITSITNVMKNIYDVWHDFELVQSYFEIFSQILRNVAEKYTENDFESNWQRIVVIVDQTFSEVIL